MNSNKKELSSEEQEALLQTLQARFEQHKNRHKGIKWVDVAARLQAHPEKLWSLQQMEASGGEPDVISFDKETGAYIFYDCAPESPKSRRSLCYDGEAWASRKQHKPESSAREIAEEMGIELLDEAQYQQLQQLGPVDTKTSSWLKTPVEMRALGGALFGDYRFGRVFVYHNGAESYYGGRGFRGWLKV